MGIKHEDTKARRRRWEIARGGVPMDEMLLEYRMQWYAVVGGRGVRR